LTFKHIGHTHTNSGFSNLWKHCYRLTNASFHKESMYLAYHYQRVTVSLHYLPRCVRSTVSWNKTPATAIQYNMKFSRCVAMLLLRNKDQQ